MCGIYGIFDRGRRPISADLVEQLDASLIHRGPDGSGRFFRPEAAPGVLLGNRRLSIIDVAGGDQPFVSADGCVAVVQNGEIFNYIELQAELKAQGVRFTSDSDTEVILRLYERHGIDGLKALNGMFAVAIFDSREQALYLVRDRIGEKPLYARDDGTRLTFASEIKTLLVDLKAQGLRAKMDLQAIDHYLTFNYVPAPWTAFEGIRHVMPGHVLRADASGLRTWRWWDLADQTAVAQPFGDWQAEFMSVLDDATRIRMRSDVAFGAFLSGGVDSSTVVGLMARHSEAPIETFCIGFDDPRFDESRFAQEAAERFGTRHRMEVAELNMLDKWAHCIFHCDQPHGDASFMPTLRVSELAAKRVKVVLTGDGGDELFAGYEKYAQFFGRNDLGDLSDGAFERAYFESISLFSPQAKRDLYKSSVATRLAGVGSFEAVAAPWFAQCGHMDRLNRALFLDMQALLCGNNLVKPDRMGMAVSIEARAPFLDWRMMELAFRTPANAKLNGGDLKHWYKRAAGPLIGENLAHRKKQMFTVPVGEWFRAERYAWLEQTLQTSEVVAALFDAKRVDQLLQSHRSGVQNNTRELRALAALALWGERFEVDVGI